MPSHVCGNVCPILVFVGLLAAKYALRRAAQSSDPDIRRAAIKSSRKTVTVNATTVESGEEICADADERVYIPAGPQGNVLGIHF
jgi:hypothetical protein